MRLVTLVILLASCRAADNGEQAYVDKELASASAALAARDETKLLVECTAMETSLPRMPQATGDKIRALCYVEMPRLMLKKGVASIKEKQTAHPELADLNCMELLIPDALKTLAKHPTTDAEITSLVDEHRRLCPAEAAKHH